ncbi:chromosome partitioning protein [Sorangium cellulosum]|uniref:Chromosome partitioning protein n=1 Tax=Sorangium cellulosum TaxID=56 RepID=A0A2L0EPQ2_SORCE|nr:AAA family ATPase [Sorangium cellulosum]AUX41250.1 chromosome partitioning protein [Sorangium cellulosum]
MRSLAFFSNKGGVGKTTLTLNIAHMLARKGKRVVTLDCDPQSNLSAGLLGGDELVDLWEGEVQSSRGRTVVSCIEPARQGSGEIIEPVLVSVADDLWLLPGHLDLSRFEQRLAEAWRTQAELDDERALDATTALDRLSDMAAAQVNADVVLIDVGPSLGALNRAALLACDAIVVPLAPDFFSVQGLATVGPSLREWRNEWEQRLRGTQRERVRVHRFLPIGYIVQQHLARVDLLPTGYLRWLAQIPFHYHRFVLDEADAEEELDIKDDEQCIALIKHLAGLAPIAQIARKPVFDLKQADGIGSSHLQAVARARVEFSELADHLIERLDRGTKATPASEGRGPAGMRPSGGAGG